MKVSDILHLEQANTSDIILHKEGLFWKSYEVSAFLFVTNIKQYSVKKKYYKNVNKEIVYLGFPQNALNSVLQVIESKNIEKNEKQVIISSFSFELNNFEKWKDSIALYKKSESMASSPRSHYVEENKIIEKIKTFSVINKTPIECQKFIIELQNELMIKQSSDE